MFSPILPEEAGIDPRIALKFDFLIHIYYGNMYRIICKSRYWEIRNLNIMFFLKCLYNEQQLPPPPQSRTLVSSGGAEHRAALCSEWTLISEWSVVFDRSGLGVALSGDNCSIGLMLQPSGWVCIFVSLGSCTSLLNKCKVLLMPPPFFFCCILNASNGQCSSELLSSFHSLCTYDR